MNEEAYIYQCLQKLCPDGEMQQNAFVINDIQLFIYADIISCDEHAAQVVFQMHQKTLEDPVIDAVYGIGEGIEDCLMDACKNFHHHDISLLRKAFLNTGDLQVVARTQENHAFQCYASTITCHGKREGDLPSSFLDRLLDGIRLRLGNKRLYCVKVYCAKMDRKCEVEVRINDIKSPQLSALLHPYVEEWDCLGGYHSEKQCFYFMQKDDTYIPSIFTKEDIVGFSEKAIALFEDIKDDHDTKKLRMRLMKLCKDDSLGMELYGFIPEIYCKYTYRDIEYGEQLFLIRNDEPALELYQNQVRSFFYIDEVVRRHLIKDKIPTKTIQKVISFSANYRAIHKALDEGKELTQLYTPGIGYLVREDYILR